MANTLDLMPAISVLQLNVSQFSDYLQDLEFSESVSHKFEENEISGSTFLALEEEDLKELVPVMGIRIKLKELMRTLKKEVSGSIISSL